jgi:vacuolar-type H+-ATPase catalytic subunit A/Vma1
MPLGEVKGLRVGARVEGHDRPATVGVGPQLLGRVIDALGRPLDDLGPIAGLEEVDLDGAPPHPLRRAMIDQKMSLGIRAWDTLIPAGRGQRVGIFAGSGVGKSTVLFDLLASVKQQAPETKILYVSSEMTRNDILFYYRKSPAIGSVPTLLLNEHLKDGSLAKVLEDTFNGDWDIVVLDSYQDAAIKLTESLGWRQKRSETWLTNLMIESAEKRGTAVLAIQHMTKTGQYMGSTYLKHATTSMLEIRFDPNGGRYLEFSKNRRGGGHVNKRLYYDLDPEMGVVYDELRFEEAYGEPEEEGTTVDFEQLTEEPKAQQEEGPTTVEWNWFK